MFTRKAKSDEVQQVPQDADVYAQRKQKKRKRYLRRAVAFFCIAALIIVIFQKRDVWMPKLEEISIRHQSVHENNGVLSEGNFPLTISSNTAYQTATMNNLLLILSDAYLYLYNTDGSMLARRQHAYGSAMLQAAGNYAMVYESGGTHFRLETTGKTLLEKNLSDPIIFGRVSDKGYTAVVTASETSACKLLVFNKKGKQIYARSCVEELTEVAFHTESDGCYAVSIHAEDGKLKSVVHNYDFAQTDEKWTSQPLDMLCISVYNTKGDDVFVLGDTCCAYLSLAGAALSTYDYPDALVCGDSYNGISAVLLRNEEKRTNSVVLMNKNAHAPNVLSFDSEVKYVHVNQDTGSITVQTRSEITSFSPEGTQIARTGISDTYDSFLRIQSELFLMGYDRIDRMEYSERSY